MDAKNQIILRFNEIVFQDLVNGKPLKQTLERLRTSIGFDIFVLDVDSRPVLYTAEQPLPAYFQNMYENGDDIICYTNSDEFQFLVQSSFCGKDAICIHPKEGEYLFTTIYPIRRDNRPAWILMLKYDEKELVEPLKSVAPDLALLCQNQLLQDAEEPNASHDSMDAIIARELILFDSGEAMHLSESQFKCQNEVLLNKAKMENFHSPFVIAAFKFRSSGESNCDYSFALTEFEYHFPNSFSLVNRGIMYAFFFDCQCESWNELDNFSYQHQLYAGVSDFFDSLENRHFFKLQAKELLQLAENTKDKKYLCLYFDHYSELMLLNASDRFGAHMLILSDVRRLAKLDKEGGTLYLDTLEQYLLCRNIPSAAAKALFIDRGTLRYRLQKILDTLNIDFESPTYAKALFASIQLFRLCPSA